MLPPLMPLSGNFTRAPTPTPHIQPSPFQNPAFMSFNYSWVGHVPVGSKMGLLDELHQIMGSSVVHQFFFIIVLLILCYSMTAIWILLTTKHCWSWMLHVPRGRFVVTNMLWQCPLCISMRQLPRCITFRCKNWSEIGTSRNWHWIGSGGNGMVWTGWVCAQLVWWKQQGWMWCWQYIYLPAVLIYILTVYPLQV